MRISDWSSDVCSSDLGLWRPWRRDPSRGDTDHADDRICEPRSAGASDGTTAPASPSVLFVPTAGDEPAGTSPPPRLPIRRAAPLGCRPTEDWTPSPPPARNSVVTGKSVSDRVDHGGRRIIQKQTKNKHNK